MQTSDTGRICLSPYSLRGVIEDASRGISKELRGIFPCAKDSTGYTQERREASRSQLDHIKRNIAAIEARQETLRRCLSVEEEVYKFLLNRQQTLLDDATNDFQRGVMSLPTFPVEIISRILWMTFCNPESPRTQNYTESSPLAKFVGSLKNDEWKRAIFSAIPDYLSEQFIGSASIFTGEGPDSDALRERIERTDPSRLQLKLYLHDSQMLDVLLPYGRRWSELTVAAYSLPTDADSQRVLPILTKCEHILPHLHALTVDHKIAAPSITGTQTFGARHNQEHGVHLRRAAFSITWLPYFAPLLSYIVDLTLYLHSTEETVLRFLPANIELPSLKRLTLHQCIGWHIVESLFTSNESKRIFPTVEELSIKGLGPNGIRRFIQLFPCPRLKRLEIVVKTVQDETISAVARAQLLEYIDKHYHHLSALSVIWGDIGSSAGGLDILSRPNDKGSWLFPDLQELEEELKVLQPDLLPLIHLCRCRLQAEGVEPLRLVRILGMLTPPIPPRMNVNALQFYVPEVVLVDRTVSTVVF